MGKAEENLYYKLYKKEKEYSEKLEKQNEELTSLLIEQYYIMVDSPVFSVKNIIDLLEKIKQKPIEEILKEV